MNGLMKIIETECTEFHDCGKLVSTTPFLHSQKCNSDYLLIMVIEGVLHLQINGEMYGLHPNELLTLPPNTMICGTRPSPQVTFLWCHFMPQCTISDVPDSKAGELCTLLYHQMLAEHDAVILLPYKFQMIRPNRLVVLLQQLLDISNTGNFSRRFAEHMLGAILFEITQQVVIYFLVQPPSRKSLRFSEISEWVRINVFHHISVGDIAERFNYNSNYLSNLFKKKTGLSLNQYIMNTKMEAAKGLLVTTDKTIKDIAVQLAFDDPRYFMRCFKHCTGLTPTAYRNAYSGTFFNTRWLPNLNKE